MNTNGSQSTAFQKSKPLLSFTVESAVNIKTNRDILLKKDCPHIVVGTPGRILGLAHEKSLQLDHIKHLFVLNECDAIVS